MHRLTEGEQAAYERQSQYVISLSPADFERMVARMLQAHRGPIHTVSLDEARWEDDGGPLRPGEDGYEHHWVRI